MRNLGIHGYRLSCHKDPHVLTRDPFILVPVCATSLAWAIGFGNIENALPLKVVIILSSMPVAFNALIPPSIYDLDLDLANSCWFVTMVLLVVILSLQLLILNQIP